MAITTQPTEPWKAGIPLIPSPQRCTLNEGEFVFADDTVIQLPEHADAQDVFAADLLARRLGACTSTRPKVWKTGRRSSGGIRFERKPVRHLYRHARSLGTGCRRRTGDEP